VIAKGCDASCTPRRHFYGRINQLMSQPLWTDAALAMVEREAPYWTVRRLTL